MTAPRLTKPAPRALADIDADRSRRDHALALQELQARVGKVHPSARFYLGRRVFTSSSRYEPTPGTRAVLLRMVAGGGGGGGTTGGANVAAGGGGFAGYYMEKWIAAVAPIIGGVITIGAGGGGGAAGANGSAGGSSSASINGKTYTVAGGPGGNGQANGATVTTAGTPAGSTAPSDADFAHQALGAYGIRTAAADAWPGAGASSPLGRGGVTTAVGNGVAAVGNGSGGGGSVSTGSNQTGGAGTAGLVVIEEYG